MLCVSGCLTYQHKATVFLKFTNCSFKTIVPQRFLTTLNCEFPFFKKETRKASRRIKMETIYLNRENFKVNLNVEPFYLPGVTLPEQKQLLS